MPGTGTYNVKTKTEVFRKKMGDTHSVCVLKKSGKTVRKPSRGK